MTAQYWWLSAALIHSAVHIWIVGANLQPQTLAGPESEEDQGRATCTTWGGSHYRTFDNKVYTFNGPCKYTLAYSHQQFNILIINGKNCTQETCHRGLDVFLANSAINLRSSATTGPTVLWDGKPFKVPGSKSGSKIERVGTHITFESSLGFIITWDGEEYISVQVSTDLQNQVSGLCGKYNGDPSDDFESRTGQSLTSVTKFVSSWKQTSLREPICHEGPELGCKTDTAIHQAKEKRAENICKDLLYDPAFKLCHAFVDPEAFLQSCKTDCCGSTQQDCMCKTMEAYSRVCKEHGPNISWRKSGRCEVKCSGGKVFKECGSSCEAHCSKSNMNAECSDTTCVEGCFCPDGWVLHNNICVETKNCPCILNDKEYSSGATIKEDCNKCQCNKGKWDCTHNPCSAKCYSYGNSHYQTFDRSSFDFLGKCSYYLLKNSDMEIIANNQGCTLGVPCSKSIKILYMKQTIKLDENKRVFLNDHEILNLPHTNKNFLVSMSSSLFMKLKLANGLIVSWDGSTRVIITAPPSFIGKTKGLCGTFDGKQSNDFMTPQNVWESNPVLFGNQWKTRKSCTDSIAQTAIDPCDMQLQKKTFAEKLCLKLKSKMFAECHEVQDVEIYYKNCMFDMCSCEQNLRDCLCPSLGFYADACASRGLNIEWRPQVDECKLECPPGQTYQVCGKPCERTCRNVAENEADDCNDQCVEGCNCPDGQSLNDKNECIPVTECPCIFHGREYPPAFTTFIGTELCNCSAARWQCRKVVKNEKVHNFQPLCGESMMFSSCAPPCPDTCSSSQDTDTCDAINGCEPGCVCQQGYVMKGDKCIPKSECPCTHGGKDYYEGQFFHMDCNKCICKNQQWQCEKKECPATCVAYGDSHYSTFDGQKYSFQGSCDYILAQSIRGVKDRFVITVHNVPCGMSGVACSKGIKIILGESRTRYYYTLHLVRGKRIVKNPRSPFQIYEVGQMVLIQLPSGIAVEWDKGTSVYIRLPTKFKNKVEGLCGNFNGDRNDDFSLPQSGPPVVKTTTFGDSWRVHSYCEASKDIGDTCQFAPYRKSWAQLKCSVLASELFEPCHGTVPYSDYMERCVFDACGCDQGGDCECLCTAIAAYAHECASNGIPIHWRSKELCGVECSSCKEYNPCMSRCPKKTCENRLIFDDLAKGCKDEQGVCFEGCDLHPCPEGQVYDSLVEPVACIPEPLCESPSCTINNKNYKEGERIDEASVCNQECEICICRNGEIDHITFGVCKHVVITTVSPPIKITNKYTTLKPPVACKKSGWTSWMSGTVPNHNNVGDKETIEGLRKKYSFCRNTFVTDIRCRIIGQQESGSYFGQQVTCDVESGFSCRHTDQQGGMCMDYEVSFYCNCSNIMTTVSTTHSTLSTDTTQSILVTGHISSTPSHSTAKPTGPTGILLSESTNSPISSQPTSPSTGSNGGRDGTTTQSGTTILLEQSFKTPKIPSRTGQPTSTTSPGSSSTTRKEHISSSTTTPSHCSATPIAPIECLLGLYSSAMIGDNHFVGSSSSDVAFDARNARLNNVPKGQMNGGAWMPRFSDKVPEIVIDLKHKMSIAGIVMQGRPDQDQWVTKYEVYISKDGNKFEAYSENENGTVKEFLSNCDRNTSVSVYFKNITTLRKIAIRPTGFFHAIALRLDLLIPCHNVTSSPKTPQTFSTISPPPGKKTISTGKPPILISTSSRKPPISPSIPPPGKKTISTGKPPILISTSSRKPPISPSIPPPGKKTISTGKPPILISTSSTTSCRYWSPWINQNQPDEEGDESENFYNQKVPNVCPSDYVTRFECREAESKLSYDKNVNNYVICDKEGFTLICVGNGASCPDYEVRVFCDTCSDVSTVSTPRVENRSGLTSTKPTAPTSTTTTAKTYPPPCKESKWLPFVSRSFPEINDGDREFMTNHELNQQCTGMVTEIACYTKTGIHYKETRDIVECTLEDGLVCSNSRNNHTCMDYMIRYWCQCPETTTEKEITPTTKPPNPGPPTRCSWSPWMNADSPNTGPGDLETISILKQKFVVCPKFDNIECRVVSTSQSAYSAGQTGVKCDPFNGLRCYNSDILEGQCFDYEVRLHCWDDSCDSIISSTVSTSLPVKPRPPTPSCGWSVWMNSFTPDYDGDEETISNLRLAYSFCATPTKIMCRTKPDKDHPFGIRYDQAGQKAITCDLNRGLVCLNSAQTQRETCFDYEVMVECSDACASITPPVGKITTPTISHSSSSLVFTGTPSSIVSGSTTFPPSISGHISSTPSHSTAKPTGPTGILLSESTNSPISSQPTSPSTGSTGGRDETTQSDTTSTGSSGIPSSESTNSPTSSQPTESTGGTDQTTQSDTTSTGPSGITSSDSTNSPISSQSTSPSIGSNGGRDETTTQSDTTSTGPSGISSSESTNSPISSQPTSPSTGSTEGMDQTTTTQSDTTSTGSSGIPSSESTNSPTSSQPTESTSGSTGGRDETTTQSGTTSTGPSGIPSSESTNSPISSQSTESTGGTDQTTQSDTTSTGPSGISSSDSTNSPISSQSTESTGGTDQTTQSGTTSTGPSGISSSESTNSPISSQSTSPSIGSTGGRDETTTQSDTTSTGSSGISSSESTNSPISSQSTSPSTGSSGGRDGTTTQSDTTSTGPSGIPSSESTNSPISSQSTESTGGTDQTTQSDTTSTGPSGIPSSESTNSPISSQPTESTGGTDQTTQSGTTSTGPSGISSSESTNSPISSQSTSPSIGSTGGRDETTTQSDTTSTGPSGIPSSESTNSPISSQSTESTGGTDQTTQSDTTSTGPSGIPSSESTNSPISSQPTESTGGTDQTTQSGTTSTGPSGIPSSESTNSPISSQSTSPSTGSTEGMDQTTTTQSDTTSTGPSGITSSDSTNSPISSQSTSPSIGSTGGRDEITTQSDTTSTGSSGISSSESTNSPISSQSTSPSIGSTDGRDETTTQSDTTSTGSSGISSSESTNSPISSQSTSPSTGSSGGRDGTTTQSGTTSTGPSGISSSESTNSPISSQSTSPSTGSSGGRDETTTQSGTTSTGSSGITSSESTNSPISSQSTSPSTGSNGGRDETTTQSGTTSTGSTSISSSESTNSPISSQSTSPSTGSNGGRDGTTTQSGTTSTGSSGITSSESTNSPISSQSTSPSIGSSGGRDETTTQSDTTSTGPSGIPSSESTNSPISSQSTSPSIGSTGGRDETTTQSGTTILLEQSFKTPKIPSRTGQPTSTTSPGSSSTTRKEHISSSTTTPSHCSATPIAPIECLLGLYSSAIIGDNHFVGSSSSDVAFDARNARLNNVPKGQMNGGAWMPRFSDKVPQIVIDLKHKMSIAGIVMQGRPDQDQWVTKYEVYISKDGNEFEAYSEDENGTVKEFLSNCDRNTSVSVYFKNITTLRKIAIRPTGFFHAIALRLDLLIPCHNVTSSPKTPQTFSTISPPPGKKTISTGKPPILISTSSRKPPISPSIPPPGKKTISTGKPPILISTSSTIQGICNTTLKVDSPSEFPDQWISSFSVSNNSVAPWEGRLGNPKSAWVPSYNSKQQWLQFDFQNAQMISGVMTQGHPHEARFVESYYVAYSINGLDFEFIKDQNQNPLIFPGNVDQSKVVTNHFPKIINVRYLRLYPLSWAPNGIALRVNFEGCPRISTSTPHKSSPTPKISKSSPTPTPPTTSCKYWSPWINQNQPDEEGDESENFYNQKVPNVCPSDYVTRFECREAESKLSYDKNVNNYVLCDKEGFTLICVGNGVSCPDYEVRVFCDTCSDVSTVSTPRVENRSGLTSTKPTAPTSTTTTAKTYPPPCKESKWLPFVSRSFPEISDGDREFMTNHELNQQCTGMVTDIACYTKTGIHYEETRDIVECTLEDGLVCSNSRNNHTCMDYMIRYWCQCPETTTEKEITPTTKPPNPGPPTRCSWSPWMNADSPNTGPGDLETISILKQKFVVCPKFDNIECRVVSTSQSAYSAGQTGVKCDPFNGLRCYNSDILEGQCFDYEVRLHCWDDSCAPPTLSHPGTTIKTPPTLSHPGTPTKSSLPTDLMKKTTVVCPTGKEWQSCAYKCSEVCNYRGLKTGACEKQEPQNCVPGCKEIKPSINCKPYEKLNEYGVCVHTQLCTCRKPDGTPSKPMEAWPNPDAPCSSCTCFNNEILCGYDHFGCPTPEPPPAVSIVTPKPVCGWSEWMNEDSPNTGLGDVELVQYFRKNYGICSTPLAIECREVTTKRDVELINQQVTCSVTEGLKCFNLNNEGKCSDYEIRVFCPCTGSSSSPTVTSNTTDLPTTQSSTTYKTVDCDWTEWMSSHVSNTIGEMETIPNLRKKYNFCETSAIVNIECQDKVTKKKVMDGDHNVVCNTEGGLLCLNSEQPNQICPDYEVRFKCDPIGSNCSTIEPTTIPNTSTLKPPHINGHTTKKPAFPSPTVTSKTTENPEPICREELVIKDTMISASSFRDSMHSPRFVRFGEPSSWMPKINNQNQYVQVDLGVNNVIVTGIKTEGSQISKTFVKKFKVLFSSDGVTWNPVRDKKNQVEVFSNVLGLSTTMFFKIPLRTRFIRLVPLSWQGHISLKMEIIGCPYNIPTSSPPGEVTEITTRTPPTVTTETPVGDCVEWYRWIDLNQPTLNNANDSEPIQALLHATPKCTQVMAIECRTATPDHTPYFSTDQNVECNTWNGLRCVGNLSSNQMCYNYEARLGCMKQDCKQPPPRTETCYQGMDVRHCPVEGCAHGLYCNGSQCVRKSECPCVLNRKVIRANGVNRGDKCETCMCFNGDVLCLPKTCHKTDCPKGHSSLNTTTCNCQCDECAPHEYQCSNGHCIPQTRRCDGIVDCLDDELDCESIPPPRTKATTERPKISTVSVTIPHLNTSFPTRSHPTKSPPFIFRTTGTIGIPEFSTSTTSETKTQGITSTLGTSTPEVSQTTLGQTTLGTIGTTGIPEVSTSIRPETKTEGITSTLGTSTPEVSQTTLGIKTSEVSHTTLGKSFSDTTNYSAKTTIRPPKSPFTTGTVSPVPTPIKGSCANVHCPPLENIEIHEGITVTLQKTNDGCCQEYKVCDTRQCPNQQTNCSAPYISVPVSSLDCCPKYQCECPFECPSAEAPQCPRGTELIEIPEKCNCTTFGCRKEPPVLTPPKCLYLKTVDVPPNLIGPESFFPVEVYELHDKWNDGPCKQCTCVKGSTNHAEVTCTEKQCEKCKKGELKVKRPGKCCDKCVPVGCSVDGKVYKIGDFIPTNSSCSTKTCKKDSSGNGYVRESHIKCPDIEKLPPCPVGAKEADKKDRHGCCMQCIPTSNLTCSTCSPQLVFGNNKKSIGYFKITLKPGVICKNMGALKDLKECSGSCSSQSVYTSVMQGFSSSCRCCQADKTTDHTVKLTCSDQTTITRNFKMPASCACQPCSGSS